MNFCVKILKIVLNVRVQMKMHALNAEMACVCIEEDVFKRVLVKKIISVLIKKTVSGAFLLKKIPALFVEKVYF